MSDDVTRLSIDDEGFLVTSLIERCPRVMMLRELVQNGVEAAVMGPRDARRIVRLYGAEIGGCRKLAIWNTGPGMNAEELFRMGDISASIRKSKGLDQNFGMGAKVAGLASNPQGMRYRSCNNGRVREVLLGRREGVYGRIRRTGSNGEPAEIHDVTEVAVREGATTAFDWTEVVLLGQRPEQDTVSNPFDGNPPVGPNWILEGLYQRLWTLPDQVEIRIAEGLHEGVGEQTFRPLSVRPAESGALRETVEIGEGVRAHYFYDPPHPERPWENLSTQAELQAELGLLSLAHRGEMYRPRAGSPWASIAPVFGIAYSPRNYSIVVELPNDYQSVPETYRVFLQRSTADQGEIQIDAFAEQVRNFAPEWLTRLQSPPKADEAASDELQEEIRRFAVAQNLARAEDDDPNRPLFKIAILRDAQDIRDRWLSGRAGRFFSEVGQLLINARYSSLLALQEELLGDFGKLGENGRDAGSIRLIAERYFIRRLARTLVLCLAKANNPEEWATRHIATATSEEALTIAADDLTDILPAIRAELMQATA